MIKVKKAVLWVSVILIIFLGLVFSLKDKFLRQEEDYRFGQSKLPELIAHAGGGIESLTLTNSLQALDSNYDKGFKFIEVDFNWTSDGRLVLIHDWGETLQRLYGVSFADHTLEDFMRLKMQGGLTQLSLEELTGWMVDHRDVYIVTDAKSENIRALGLIRKKYPQLLSNFIAQIYFFEEYPLAKGMGYEHIILTLYRSLYSDRDVLSFARKKDLLAVAMPVYRALNDLPLKLRRIGVPSYVHTVNEDFLRQELRRRGVYGVYTDFLKPQ
ncbi:MAG: amidohydrolase [Candidatus Omnitrophica bacterium]|nr:amidohydrolase [Candidatus Omnitrophota bacterium]